MINLYDYVVQRLREDKKVNIKIVGEKNKKGYLKMDWIIDGKLILKDFPFEVFEGEEGEDLEKYRDD